MKSKIKDIDDLYSGIDKLVEALKEEGFVESATKLHELVHETAWTTGSELLGELSHHLNIMNEQYATGTAKQLKECQFFCKNHRRVMGIY